MSAKQGFSGVWFPTLTMLASQIAAALAVLTVSVLVPLAAPAFNVPATWIGGFTSIVYLFGAVSGTMTGDLIRRFGAIRITQCAVLSSAIGLVLFATGQPLAGVLAAIFMGISYGQLNPTSADVLVRCTPANLRPLVFSIKQTGVVFGGGTGGCAGAGLRAMDRVVGCVLAGGRDCGSGGGASDTTQAAF